MAHDRVSVSTELAKLAGGLLGIGDELTEAAGDSVRDLLIPGAAFGNTQGAADLHRTHSEAVDTAVSVGSKLSEVFEGDADRIYSTAFAFNKGDEETQRRMKRITR